MQQRSVKPERLLVYSGAAVLAFLFVWFELRLLLLAFAGVLVAVLLHAMSSWINRHTRLNGPFAYLATIIVIAAVLTGAGFLLIPRIAQQIAKLSDSLPSSIGQLQVWLRSTSWGSELLTHMRSTLGNKSLVHMQQIASFLTDAVTDLVVVVVVGFFAALNPRDYKEGLLVLFPEERRNKLRQITDDLQHQLKWWMLGQTVPMVAIGIASGVGLRLMHVPLPWTLGLVTGVAVFLPYAGTILAGILSVLMALQRSPHTALWVLLLYTLLHLAEGYVLTPLAQRKAVRLPPVLTILMQYFMWSVAGVLGLALAAPLAGAGMVLVKELFLQVPADQDVVPDSPQSNQAA